jgi:hypothetical protein
MDLTTQLRIESINIIQYRLKTGILLLIRSNSEEPKKITGGDHDRL